MPTPLRGRGRIPVANRGRGRGAKRGKLNRPQTRENPDPNKAQPSTSYATRSRPLRHRNQATDTKLHNKQEKESTPSTSPIRAKSPSIKTGDRVSLSRPRSITPFPKPALKSSLKSSQTRRSRSRSRGPSSHFEEKVIVIPIDTFGSSESSSEEEVKGGARKPKFVDSKPKPIRYEGGYATEGKLRAVKTRRPTAFPGRGRPKLPRLPTSRTDEDEEQVTDYKFEDKFRDEKPEVQSLQCQRKPLHYVPLILAELAGTATFVFVGCLGCEQSGPDPYRAAISFGTALHLAVQVFGSISGGHFNPAVSLAVFISRKMDIVQLISYIIAQYIGAFIGFEILCVFLDDVEVCALRLLPEMTWLKTFLIEALTTYFLIMVVCSMLDRRNTPSSCIPMRMGFLLMGSVYITIWFTGSGLNPARALPPTVHYKTWTNCWIWQVSPYVASIFAAVTYRALFDSSEPYSMYSLCT